MADTVLLEILSADPIGPLSLAQGRTAVQGDALANLFAFFGETVRRDYYVNDMGHRAATLCDTVRRLLLLGADGEDLEGRFDATTRSLADALLAQRGDAALRSATDEEWRDLCASAVPNALLELQQATLNRLGVRFDTWFEERSLLPDAVEAALSRVRDTGRVEHVHGSDWFTMPGGDRVLLRRENGAFTYFAVDIAYHLNKRERGAGLMVDVWGPAYHRHRTRLVEAMVALGVTPPPEVVVTAPVRLENDGLPVHYLDAADLPLDPLLQAGCVEGLRLLLNAAPPDKELSVEIDALNHREAPDLLVQAWALNDALRTDPPSPAANPLPASAADLEAILKRMVPARKGAPDLEGRLHDATFGVSALLRDAWTRRRPDLLGARLIALVDGCSPDGKTVRLPVQPETRAGLGAALNALLTLLGVTRPA